MKELEYHPIACIFPLMADAGIEALANDIRESGQIQTGLLFEGKILDGRNRYAACKLAGVEFKAVKFKGTRTEALAHVWGLNRLRRHLSSSQAAAAEAMRAKLDAEYAAEVDAIKKAKAKRTNNNPSNGGKFGKSGSKTQQKQGPEPSGETIPPTVKRDESKRTPAKRAESVGTNRKYIEQADRLVEEAPELAQKVVDGEMSIPQATKALKGKTAVDMTDQERGRKTLQLAKTYLEHALRAVGDTNALLPDPKLCSTLELQIIASLTQLKTWRGK